MTESLDKNGLTEEEFLRQYNPDKYPKPSLTADIVVFRQTPGERNPSVLLVRRGGHPFLGRWALPGGFAMRDEPLEATAVRELEEETGVKGVDMILTGVYSAPGRDPRGWVVSAAYAALLHTVPDARAGDDAAAVRWVPLVPGKDAAFRLDETPDENDRVLAFDHDRILTDAVRRIFGLGRTGK